MLERNKKITILSLILPSPLPGDLPVVVSVRHLDETGPDVIEETLRSFVFLTVDLPAGHLTDPILRPLKVLKTGDITSQFLLRII